MPKIDTKIALRSMTKIAKNASGSLAPGRLEKFLRTTKDKSSGLSFKQTLERKTIPIEKLKKIIDAEKQEGIGKTTAPTQAILQQIQKDQKKMETEQQERETVSNISSARSEGHKWERQRLAAFGGKEETFGGQVVKQEAIQERFRKDNSQYLKQSQTASGIQHEQEKKYEIHLKERGEGRGAESSQGKINQLLSRVMKEEDKSQNQKSGASISVKMEGSGNIDQLTHPHNAGNDSFLGGPMQVRGLSKAPNAAPSQQSSTGSSHPPSRDLTDLDIG